MTSKQKEHVLDTVPQEMVQETTVCVYARPSKRPCDDKRPDHRPRVNVRPCVVNHKREGNTKAHKVIGGKEQRNHVIKGDLNSPMVSEEEGMPMCVTNGQEHRDVAMASIPNTCVQRVTSDDSKTNLSSETEG